MKVFGQLMATLIVTAILFILQGFVFSKLWLWFIVPMFGTRPVKIIEAIALLWIIQFTLSIFVKKKSNDEKESFTEKLITYCIYAIVISTLALGGGWIIKLLM